RQYDAEGGVRFRPLSMMRAAFQALMKFHRRLEQQKQSTTQQYQISPGKTLAEYREQRFSEGHEPGNAGEQREPHEHRETQADNPCLVALVLRQLVRQDRDEDQVVYPEDHLEDDQGQQAEQDS